MNIIFLGGVHTDSLAQYIRVKSIGPMQNAADVLQKNYIYGLTKISLINNIDVINLPYVGSYPSYFKDKKFHAIANNETIYERCNVHNHSFNNIKGLKNLSRFFISLRSILTVQKKDENYIIVCYSMHLPFLLSCYLTRLLRKKSKYYIIIPDLPEYMSVRKGITKLVHNVISKISYYIVNKSNGAALITSHMSERFEPTLNYVVIEGISPPAKFTDFDKDSDDWWPDNLVKNQYFLYTGTLDKRYGIRDLINAFIKANVKEHILVICGDGNDRPYVLNMSMQNANIKYLGQMEYHKIKILQENAALLINPRSSEGEYTKYSFPSKIIEYMNSGVPVLMYRLEGIPDSYLEYFYEIKSKDDFVHKLNMISTMKSKELKAMGEKAKDFIITHTNPIKQANKLVTLFFEDKK